MRSFCFMRWLKYMGTRAIMDDSPESSNSDAMDVEGVESACIEGARCEIETDIVSMAQRPIILSAVLKLEPFRSVIPRV